MNHIADITQLVLRERQGRDRLWWDQMAACYHPTSTVSLSWFSGSGADFVKGSRAMSEGGTRPVHRLSPPVVHLQHDRAVVELPAAIELRFDLAGVEADLTSCARLLYRTQRSTTGWLISALTCIYERDTLTPALPGTTLPVDADRLRSFRSPNRCLAYQLSLGGHTAGDELYGDDQPDRVNDLYSAAFEWLRGSDA
jgi:hypothetical protein